MLRLADAIRARRANVAAHPMFLTDSLCANLEPAAPMCISLM
jgi:hypothetical protein